LRQNESILFSEIQTMATKKPPTPTANIKQIWDAVQSNDPSGLVGIEDLALLDKPAKKHPHSTPLLAAFSKGHIDVGNELLSLGCDCLKTNTLGVSTIEWIAAFGHWDWVEGQREDIQKHIQAGSLDAELALSGLVRVALSQEKVEWAEWARQLGAKMDAPPNYQELPNTWLLSVDEWTKYKLNHGNRPESFDVDYSEDWVFRALNDCFAWSGRRIPLELYTVGGNDEIKAWAKQHGIHTDTAQIPEDYRTLYLRMAVDGQARMNVPVRSLAALIDSLNELLPTEEDKQWMWLELFHASVAQGKEVMQKNIHDYVSERYGVSLVNSVWPVLEQPKATENMSFTPKPTWRDFHPIGLLIFQAGDNEMVAEGIHPRKSCIPEERHILAARSRLAMRKIKGLFDLGLSPAMMERGWGYTLAHQAASAGAGALLDWLCTFEDLALDQRSGKRQKGKTAREIAQNKGYSKVVAILESAELKRKHAQVTQHIAPNYDGAL
jgi:hypothetical protein